MPTHNFHFSIEFEKNMDMTFVYVREFTESVGAAAVFPQSSEEEAAEREIVKRRIGAIEQEVKSLSEQLTLTVRTLASQHHFCGYLPLPDSSWSDTSDGECKDTTGTS